MDADPLAPTVPNAGTLYVLDAHGMIYQMFHGVGPMSAPDGRPTNAVFGVMRAVMDLYDHGADYLLAAFDLAHPTFREDAYPAYKANRTPPPADLLTQEPMIHAVLDAMRIPALAVPGFEADDVMATLAAEGAGRGLAVFLCTSDKDCRQLLSDRVAILNLRKKEKLDAARLMAEWGVTPAQVVDFQALVGDPTDNVPGVPGVGPKTAAKWLQKYGTLENLTAHADELGGPKLRDAFKHAVANGHLATSRELVRLRADVPLDVDWDGWRRRPWDGQKLLELCQEFGFRGFANKVRQVMARGGAAANAALLGTAGVKPAAKPPAPPGDVPPPPKPHPARPSLFDAIEADAGDGGAADLAFGANAPAATDAWGATDYRLVDTPEALAAFLADLTRQPRAAFDLETTALDPLTCQVVGYAFCWRPGVAYYLPVRGPAGAAVLDPDATLGALRPWFEDPAVAKVNQNIKYDLLVLRAHGVSLAGVAGDPMVADYLMHAGTRTHNLDDLTRVHFAHENTPIVALIGKKGKNQLTLDRVDVAKVKDYACEDADAAWRLADRLEPELAAAGLRKLYDEVEVPLIEVLAELEFNGVRLDVEFLNKLSAEMDGQLAEMEAAVHAAAGQAFNLASPKQLREVLFDRMKLPVQKRTGTTNEPSTDAESLERLAALGHEVPKRLVGYRAVAKLKGTYVDALPALVNPNTGRVHTSFNQTVTSTGRLSSSDPNLQNVPARTDQGKQVRQAFIPRDGWRLVTADYSQVELRLLAHFCGDAALRQAFAADRDVHAQVAAEIFKVPEEQVTAAQRRVAKTVNFGVIYGISATGLAVRVGVPRAEAEKFIDDYFARFPAVLEYQDGLLAKAARDGYVGTLLGRRRAFKLDPRDVSSPYQGRTQAAREAINMEIQGSAADLMKLAMLAVHRRLAAAKLQAKLLLSVHDELVLEAPPAEVSVVAAVCRAEMAGALELSVPLRVDVAAGPNWLDVEDV